MTRQKKKAQQSTANDRPPIPAALMEVIDRAMARNPADRYAHAGELAEVVGAWLRGLEKRRAARALCREARQILRQSEQHVTEADKLEASLVDSPPRTMDTGSKQRQWDLEHKVHESRRIAAALNTKAQQVLITALGNDPELTTAHRLLAEMYRAEHRQAERRRDRDAASRWQVLLEAHDTGPHSAYLHGDALFSLTTEPPGARVHLERFEVQARRLVAVPVTSIGRSPLERTPINHGSYILRAEADGFATMSIPLFVEREAHEQWMQPGMDSPRVVQMLKQGEIGTDECLVEAGWCITGGDTLSLIHI